MPDEGTPEAADLITDLQALYNRHEENGCIDILYDTKVFYGQLGC